MRNSIPITSDTLTYWVGLVGSVLLVSKKGQICPFYGRWDIIRWYRKHIQYFRVRVQVQRFRTSVKGTVDRLTTVRGINQMTTTQPTLDE